MNAHFTRPMSVNMYHLIHIFLLHILQNKIYQEVNTIFKFENVDIFRMYFVFFFLINFEMYAITFFILNNKKMFFL